MTRATVAALLRAALAALQVAALVAPSVVLRSTAADAGVGGSRGLDLVLVSLVVGVLYAVLSHRAATRDQQRSDPVDWWIAEGVGLGILALGASLLPVALLLLSAPRSGVLGGAGLPDSAPFTIALVAAAGLAHSSRWTMLRWLDVSPRTG